MDNYAIVNSEGKVINMIIWDGVSTYSPPSGCQIIKTDNAAIGWDWDGQSFVNPNPAPTPE